MKKFVIFDIDGTLNRTDLYAVEAYQKALRKRGCEVSKEEVISCIGLSPAAIIERFFGSLEGEALRFWREEIETSERELMKKKARAFNVIEDALKKLKAKGYGLAVCSNAFPPHIESVLACIGLRNYFDVLGTLELGKDKAEALGRLLRSLEPVTACMVGDRRFDLEAARTNGIPLVGCAYGYAPDEIREADIVVREPGEIPGAVMHLI